MPPPTSHVRDLEFVAVGVLWALSGYTKVMLKLDVCFELGAKDRAFGE